MEPSARPVAKVASTAFIVGSANVQLAGVVEGAAADFDHHDRLLRVAVRIERDVAGGAGEGLGLAEREAERIGRGIAGPPERIEQDPRAVVALRREAGGLAVVTIAEGLDEVLRAVPRR